MADPKIAILSFLEHGEASAKQLCIALGMAWPAELEKARHHITVLVRRGSVRKSVRPTWHTREAYYSLTRHDGDTATGGVA